MFDNKDEFLTVFDFFVTNEELKNLLIFHYKKNDYLTNTSNTTRITDLAVLFKSRGEYSLFKHYISLATEYDKELQVRGN